jgi:CO/xanthine dehydrogenase Mo-binding subunit
MTMADTDRTPNDGTTAGSATTPRTFPLVRRAAAAARGLLLAAAGKQFNADRGRLEVSDGAVSYSGKKYTYADLARSPELAAAYKEALPAGTAVTDSKDWPRRTSSLCSPRTSPTECGGRPSVRKRQSDSSAGRTGGGA